MAQPMLILRMSALMLALRSAEAKMEIISSKADVMLQDDHMLLCKAGGEGEITWQRDREDVDDSQVEKVDETSSKLFIRKARMEDAGLYTCHCQYDSGHTDNVNYQIYVYERPSFGSTPVYHEFLEGQNVTVPCVVTGQPVVEVTWQRDQQLLKAHGRRTGLPSDPVANTHQSCGRVRVLSDHSLEIRDIRRDDRGSYVCEGRIKGRLITEHLTISITINTPPKVKIREEVKRVMAGPETNVSLICLVEGLPPPNITWAIPVTSDASRHKYNSDRSVLTVWAVARRDYGPYTCTAKNKIAESSATITLDVTEHPLVVLSEEEVDVSPDQNVSVSCNVSGHPAPSLQWLRTATNHRLDSSKGRVRVEDGSVLVIDAVAPSDGGRYSCMALSSAGNATKVFRLQTWPGPPSQVTASPGPASIHFSLGPLGDGGLPITHFTLQWRRGDQDQWAERSILSTEPLVVRSLDPYTSYTVRLAARNRLGQGGFSSSHTLRTLGIGEPDRPVLSANEARVEGTSFSLPLSLPDDGGSPIMHYTIRYRLMSEGEEWRERNLPSNSTVISLWDLRPDADYHLEVVAVNHNGTSKPAALNFNIPPPPPVTKATRTGVGKGAVVGIVMMIFLLLLVAVDAACCYANRCGLLMFLAVRLKVLKAVEEKEGEATDNGDLKLSGLDSPRGQNGSQQSGGHVEVTCDKAPLTRFEKPPNGDPITEA